LNNFILSHQKVICPNAVLYCGWYSYAKYVDAFTWYRGAIGYHIASSECTTLKKPGSKVWSKMMLEKGVAAIGPVDKPYVQSLNVPETFFRLPGARIFNISRMLYD
jgi:uncharacterized protein (TIGR03790 family)